MFTSDIATTKMTSKGQVVIPEEIREFLNLETGVKFIVMAMDDSIIFKKINPISQQDIKQLLEASRAMAAEYNFKESEIPEIIKEVRAEFKKRASKSIKPSASRIALKSSSRARTTKVGHKKKK